MWKLANEVIRIRNLGGVVDKLCFDIFFGLISLIKHQLKAKLTYMLILCADQAVRYALIDGDTE